MTTPRTHGHARLRGRMRLMCKAVKIKAIDSLREHPIAGRLHVEGIFLPFRIGSEPNKAFGAYEPFTKNMAHRRSQLYAAAIVRAQPEFAHRPVDATAGLQFFKVAGAIRFCVGNNPVLVTEFGEMSVVVLSH